MTKKKGKRHNRNQSGKKKLELPSEEEDNDDNDLTETQLVAKKCPHLPKSVRLNNLQNKVPHMNLGQCGSCEVEAATCICLCCCRLGCDRNSEERHSLMHYQAVPSHPITVHLQNWLVWCYDCDMDIPVQPNTDLQKCITLLLKALKLNAPPDVQAAPTTEVIYTSPSTKKPSRSTKGMQQHGGRIKGLSNLGNTCFFNAVMQNLCQTELLQVAMSCISHEEFSQGIRTRDRSLPQISVKVQGRPGPLTTALSKLFTDAKNSSQGTLNPRQLFNEICKKAPRFSGYRQQDSQELLRYLLDSVKSEELKRVKTAVLHSFGVNEPDDAKKMDDKSKQKIKDYGACAQAPLVDSVFAGQLVSIVLCHECRQESLVQETFLDLSLPLTAPQKPKANFKLRGKKSKENSVASSKGDTLEEEKAEDLPSVKKSPSKHQLKTARKQERKGKKAGKGGRRSTKGQKRTGTNDESHKERGEVSDEGYVQEDEGNDERGGKRVSDVEHEDDKFAQMNVSDIEGDGEEESKQSSHGAEKSDEELGRRKEEEKGKMGEEEEGMEKEEKNEKKGDMEGEEEENEKEEDGKKLETINERGEGAIKKMIEVGEITGEGNKVENNMWKSEESDFKNKKETGEQDEVLSNAMNLDQDPPSGTTEQNKASSPAISPCEETVVETNCCKVRAEKSKQFAKECTQSLFSSTPEQRTAFGGDAVNKSDTQSAIVDVGDGTVLEHLDVKIATNYESEIESYGEVSEGQVSERKEKDCTPVRTSEHGEENSGTEDQNTGVENTSGLINEEPLAEAISVLSFTSEETDNSLKAEGSECEKNNVAVISDVPSEESPENGTNVADVCKKMDSSRECTFDNENNSKCEVVEKSDLESTAFRGNLTAKNTCSEDENSSSEAADKFDSESTALYGNSAAKIVRTESGSSHSEVAGRSDSESTVSCGNSSCAEPGFCETRPECQSSDSEHEAQGLNSVTVAPLYEAREGEWSVMSCLSHFCAPEVLEGRNKFACGECTKRAMKNAKPTNKEQDDSSDDEGGNGAKASKPKTKDVKHQTVYTEATKQLLVAFAPPVLTLHFKRFQQIGFGLRKVPKHVDFPLQLDLGPFCSRRGETRADSDGRVMYSLYGVVEHSGGMNSGHYTAYVKMRDSPVKGMFDKISTVDQLTSFLKEMWSRKSTAVSRGVRCQYAPACEGSWFYVSDSHVSAVTEANVLKSQAYMLFYERLPILSC